MANFGIGLGSFLSGAVQGAQAYQGIKNMQSQAKLTDMKVKEAERNYAENQRNADIQAEVNRIGQIGLEAAQAEHGDNNKLVLDKYYNDTIPKQQQHLIAAGKVEAADMLGKFMETKQAKQLTEASANAIRMASNGDYDGLGPAIENILNVSNGVFGGDDSYKFQGITQLKDDKGVATGGAQIDFTDSSGKKQSMTFNNQSELIGFIRNNAMPDKIVEYAYDQQKQAQAAKAKQIEDERNWKQEQTKMEIQHGYGLAKDNNQSANTIAQKKADALIKSQLEGAGGGSSKGNEKVAQAEAAAAYLRSNGYTDDQIRAYVPALLGVQNNSKNMSVRIEDTIKTLSEIDTAFGRLSNADKIKQAKDYIAMIDGASAQSGGDVENPFPSGGNQQSRGLSPYVDTKTGAVVYK